MQFWENSASSALTSSSREPRRDNRPAWMAQGSVGGGGVTNSVDNRGEKLRNEEEDDDIPTQVDETRKQREQPRSQWRGQWSLQSSSQFLEGRIRQRQEIQIPFLWTPSPPQSPQRRVSSHKDRKSDRQTNTGASLSRELKAQDSNKIQLKRKEVDEHDCSKSPSRSRSRSPSRSRSRSPSKSSSRSPSRSRSRSPSRSRRHRKHRRENRSRSRPRSGSESRSKRHHHHRRHRHHHHRSHRTGEGNDASVFESSVMKEDSHRLQDDTYGHDRSTTNKDVSSHDNRELELRGNDNFDDSDEVERYKRDVLGLLPQTQSEADKNISSQTQPLLASTDATRERSEVFITKTEEIEIEEVEDEEEIGPSLPANFVPPSLPRMYGGHMTSQPKTGYGGSLLKGEGAAMASFVQQGIRIPRRGEVSWSGDQIEKLESVGFCMSGSRHKRMNEVRLRKENQVFTAEEKRALAIAKIEEKQAHEQKVLREFSDMIRANEANAISNEEEARAAAQLAASSTKLR